MRKSVRSEGSRGEFSGLAALSPPFYLDPNELARREIKAELVAKGKPTAKKTGDDSIVTAHSP